MKRFFGGCEAQQKAQRFVVINQNSGYLMVDVLNALVRKGADVSLITGRLIMRSTPLHSKVRLYKVMKYTRETKLCRILSWGLSFVQILFIVLTRCRGAHLLIVSNPPLTTFLPLFCSNTYSLLVFDVYPDVFCRTGMFCENHFLVRCWRRVNKRVFPSAKHLFTLSESMAVLLRRYSGTNEVEVMPLWGDCSFSRLMAKSSNPFLINLGWHNAFVVFYSGNLGSTHDVGVLAHLAERLNMRSDIKMLIVGDGEGQSLLKKELQERHLNNYVLLPLQPVDKIPFTFGAADLAIASQASALSGISIPSKVFSYLTAGLPLLCVGAVNSDLDRLIKRYEPGRCFVPSDIEGMGDFVEELANNPEVCKNYRFNALAAAGEFTVRNADKIVGRLASSSFMVT